MCHVILAIPILALVLFFFLPFRTALSIYLPVAAASGFVYFKMMTAMRSKVHSGLEEMVGEVALVIEDIDLGGKVRSWMRYGGERRTARGFIKGRR
jgi:membrane protein implicated in regulation of membrane protease activity